MKTLQTLQFAPVLALAVMSIPAFAGSMDAPGVPNFHQVNQKVYRGGQPSAEGFQSLAKMGVKTVIDLRREDEHSARAEARIVQAAGMKYINFPLYGVVAPPEAVVSKILAIFDSKDAGPVFVHCKRGADRTGTVIAAYRMSHDHWDNAKALKEAKSYGMSWTQIGMKHYIAEYRPMVDATTVDAAGSVQ
jgi:tyrosine-protein phosphatase SIW14